MYIISNGQSILRNWNNKIINVFKNMYNPSLPPDPGLVYIGICKQFLLGVLACRIKKKAIAPVDIIHGISHP